jgi:hypothetical protein
MHDDLARLVRLQSDGATQIDQRLQQWQTTISEQARVALRQLQEMNRNAELLEKLLQSSQLVEAMQQPLQSTLERMTEVDRFHEAAVGLSEAVMVLNTQLQRSGHLGRQTVRRRSANNTVDNNTAQDSVAPQVEEQEPVVLRFENHQTAQQHKAALQLDSNETSLNESSGRDERQVG